MLINRIIITGIVLLISACNTTQTADWDSEEPYTPESTPKVGDIIHTATGHRLTQGELFDSLKRYPLVYVGEVHDNPASHRLQLQVLKALHANNPGKLALGMEMFTSDQQPSLDKWVQGELSEKAFLRQSKWFDNWRTDFELYRDLLIFCRDNNIAVVGLNAPKPLGRKV